MLKIIKDVDLFDKIKKYDYTLLGVNIKQSMSQGLARDIALNYPYVHDMNLQTPYGDLKKLGTILECSKEDEPTIILMFITKGYSNKKKDENPVFLDYDALVKCLHIINNKYKGKNICCPLLGGSRFDGNGDRDKILNIIEETLTDVNVTLYDYQQLTRNEKYWKQKNLEKEVWEISKRRYNYIVRKRKHEEKLRKEKNGRAKN